MRLRYLLDTDWAIEYLHANQPITERVNEQMRRRTLGLSPVSLAELYEGVYGSSDFQRSEEMIRRFLHGLRLLHLDKEVCKLFGRERRRLREVGRYEDVGDLDILIAATALRHDLTLLTQNRRHFELIQGLKIESI